MRLMIIVQSNPQLAQIVDALAASSRLASCLNCRQEQGDENADDRNHDQQLDQRKTPCFAWNGTALHRRDQCHITWSRGARIGKSARQIVREPHLRRKPLQPVHQRLAVQIIDGANAHAISTNLWQASPTPMIIGWS